MLNMPCVIFAGGKSSRMGEDKALLPFSSYTTLTEFQYVRLSKIFTSVYISCKEKSKFAFQAQFIEDIPSQTYAPTLGFISAFAYLSEESFFAISVDAPFINAKIIQELIKKDTLAFDATIAKTDNGLEPLCGVYHRSLQEKFLLMQEKQEHRLGRLLKSSKLQTLYFEDTEAFLNLNHKEEYLQALEILKSERSY